MAYKQYDLRSKPNMPAYWPNGMPGPDIEFGDNPVVICTDQTGYDRDKRYVLNGDFGLNIQIPYVTGLSLKLGASFDKTFRFRKIWQTPWYLYSWDGTSRDESGQPILQQGKKGYDDARLNQSTENNYNIQLSTIHIASRMSRPVRGTTRTICSQFLSMKCRKTRI